MKLEDAIVIVKQWQPMGYKMKTTYRIERAAGRGYWSVDSDDIPNLKELAKNYKDAIEFNEEIWTPDVKMRVIEVSQRVIEWPRKRCKI